MPPQYDFTGPNAEAERERMRRDYAIRTDPQGRRIAPDGRYLSPAAFGDAPPDDTTGMFRQRPRWNPRTGQWETPIDWTNIANLATVSALTAGAGSAIGAGGPAASAAPTAAGSGGGTGGTSMAGGGFWTSLGKWLGGPVGQQAIQTGGQLAGNWMMNRGANRAIDEQSRANREALDWEKDLYNQAQTRLSDLAGGGRPLTPATADSVFASGRLDSPRISGLTRPSDDVIDLSQQAPGTFGTMPVPNAQGAGELVRIQAPDGDVRDLPVVQAAQAIRLGARRVA